MDIKAWLPGTDGAVVYAVRLDCDELQRLDEMKVRHGLETREDTLKCAIGVGLDL